jgi:hypothetical protein
MREACVSLSGPFSCSHCPFSSSGYARLREDDILRDLLEVISVLIAAGAVHGWLTLVFFGPTADRKEFIKICTAVGTGFIVMGVVGYFVKLSRLFPLK